jgi:hypothetical protein
MSGEKAMVGKLTLDLEANGSGLGQVDGSALEISWF